MESRRRRIRVEAAVARSVGRVEDRRLAVETEDAAVDIRLLQQHADVVDEVARGEVVGAVDDQVIGTADLHCVRRGEARRLGRRRRDRS